MTERFTCGYEPAKPGKGYLGFFRKNSKGPPASGAKLDSLLNLVKTSVDKIKARGGEVFVRTPSSNPHADGESMGFPRDKY